MSLALHLRAVVAAWLAETERRKAFGAAPVETEFLPAALEVMHAPPSPLGRGIGLCIIAIALGAVGWACLAHIDTVAVAQGRLTPAGRLRSVEAVAPGVVRQIAVREGDRVVAGQLLVAMDPTIADADAASAATELATADLALARSRALLSYGAEPGRGRPALASPSAAIDRSAALVAERQVIAARIEVLEAKLAAVDARRRAAEAAVGSTRTDIVKLERTLPIQRSLLESQETLEARGYGARQRTLQQRQVVIAAEQDLESQRHRLQEALAQVVALEHERSELRRAFVAQAAQERAEAEALSATRRQVLSKAAQSRDHQRLVAPVSGVVQAVTVSTLGEVAEGGEPLVTIVPDDEPLVAEVFLENRDRGRIQNDARVVVKLDAYPFTRFGSLEGRIVHVASDAIVDEKQGLVFPTRIRLVTPRSDQSGAIVPRAGMSLTAEIITGRRRVISMLISPIAKAIGEAGREP